MAGEGDWREGGGESNGFISGDLLEVDCEANFALLYSELSVKYIT